MTIRTDDPSSSRITFHHQEPDPSFRRTTDQAPIAADLPLLEMALGAVAEHGFRSLHPSDSIFHRVLLARAFAASTAYEVINAKPLPLSLDSDLHNVYRRGALLRAGHAATWASIARSVYREAFEIRDQLSGDVLEDVEDAMRFATKAAEDAVRAASSLPG